MNKRMLEHILRYLKIKYSYYIPDLNINVNSKQKIFYNHKDLALWLNFEKSRLKCPFALKIYSNSIFRNDVLILCFDIDVLNKRINL